MLLSNVTLTGPAAGQGTATLRQSGFTNEALIEANNRNPSAGLTVLPWNVLYSDIGSPAPSRPSDTIPVPKPGTIMFADTTMLVPPISSAALVSVLWNMNPS